MKRIVFLSFYFTPDLSAGSFRNSSLADELALKAKNDNIIIEVYTTFPNRYKNYRINPEKFEIKDNLIINRISIPDHNGGMLDQIFSYFRFYREVLIQNRGKKISLVYASSSRLFTAFLGYKLAKKNNVKLYLDIRDIFVDTINDVLKSRLIKFIISPVLKKIERDTFNYATHINLISAGFENYFQSFTKSKYSFFTNGIDSQFIDKSNISESAYKERNIKTIVYAGNIGEGQGLEKIIPDLAFKLKGKFQFKIIGEGGTKSVLNDKINKLNLDNVELLDPVRRTELFDIYKEADFLFLHLNDYPAFRKVLPSKIFELATLDKPILAGVSGYAAQFIKNEISDSFVFNPCDVDSVFNFLISCEDNKVSHRQNFIQKYRRDIINSEMSKSILSYV